MRYALAIMLMLSACADGDRSTSEPTSTTSNASESTGDCYFVESGDGTLINLGEVGSEEGEEAADAEVKAKSNIYIYNCSGEVHVTGDSAITTGASDE